MKVQTNDLNLYITWQHNTKIKNKNTICRIYDDNKDGKQIAESICKTYYKDEYVKDTGRRISLQRAIDCCINELNDTGASIWKSYFDMIHKPELTKLYTNGQV